MSEDGSEADIEERLRALLKKMDGQFDDLKATLASASQDSSEPRPSGINSDKRKH